MTPVDTSHVSGPQQFTVSEGSGFETQAGCRMFRSKPAE